MTSTLAEGPRTSLRSYVNRVIVGLAALVLIAALILVVAPIDPVAKLGWVTLLIGAELGLVLPEIAALSGRRREDENSQQLLEPARSRVRSAYRLRVFLDAAPIAAVEDGSSTLRDEPHVVQIRYSLAALGLDLDALGFDQGVDELVEKDEDGVLDFSDRLKDAVADALPYTGSHTSTFSDLARDIGTLRRDESKAMPRNQRALLIKRVATNLRETSGYAAKVKVGKAWNKVGTLWNGGHLDDRVDTMLDAFIAYFVLLGLDNLGFKEWEEQIKAIAKLRVRSPGRSLDRVIEDIEAKLMPA